MSVDLYVQSQRRGYNEHIIFLHKSFGREGRMKEAEKERKREKDRQIWEG